MVPVSEGGSLPAYPPVAKPGDARCGWLVICPGFLAREVSGHGAPSGTGDSIDCISIHEGIHRMRFTDFLGRSERSELSQMEAAELLGISERTLRRCTGVRTKLVRSSGDI